MERVICKSGNTAPGEGQICYIILKHPSNEVQRKLLNLYHKVWAEGRMPRAWKEAVVIPIRRPGKDPTKPSNYRPIALISNVCKIVERMITDCLTCVLEKNTSITSFGSRKEEEL